MITPYGFLQYELIKTTKRLTFDIIDMIDAVKFNGGDDDDYYMFIASNGYQIISRSRMDIQTERIWLWGGTTDDTANRSGTMIFSSNEKRDKAYDNFVIAINEWDNHMASRFNIPRLSDYIKGRL